MGNTPRNTSAWPIAINCIVLIILIASFAFYTLVERRRILNDIERMVINNRETDDKASRNEQRIKELDSKLQRCQMGSKTLLEYQVLNGKLFVYVSSQRCFEPCSRFTQNLKNK